MLAENNDALESVEVTYKILSASVLDKVLATELTKATVKATARCCKTNLFDSVGEARVVGGEWHLMNKSDVGIVQLRHHVQQNVSTGCNHNAIATSVTFINLFSLHVATQPLTIIRLEVGRYETICDTGNSLFNAPSFYNRLQ